MNEPAAPPTSGPAPTPAAEPPSPPELAPAMAAFMAGNHRAVHAALATLRANDPTPEVVAAARALEARLAIDPWAFRVAVIALGVLFLCASAYLF